MAGAVLFGWLQDRIGRKWSLAITSVICSVSVAICYVSDMPAGLNARRGVFFLAKTVVCLSEAVNFGVLKLTDGAYSKGSL
jgi:MFS family permease